MGDFELGAQAVIRSSGGIGGNHDLVRKSWPARLGTPPGFMVAGVPAHVDGRMLAISREAGAEGRAAQAIDELAVLSVRLHAALVKAGLRSIR